jgi:hypothetical protein
VRLATPPRLMVTNETTESEQSIRDDVSQDDNQMILANSDSNAGFSFETLKRAVASDLLTAELLGRSRRLTVEEAKRLAESVFQRLDVGRENTPSDEIARLTTASWLGLGGHLNVPIGAATGQKKRIIVTRFRMDDDGYEEVLPPDDLDSTVSREVFDLSWSASMGACNGYFELKGLSLAPPHSKQIDFHDQLLDSWVESARKIGVDEDRINRGRQKYADSQMPQSVRPGMSDDNVDWKAKYLALEFGARMAKGEFLRYRERLVERLIETLI